MSVQNFSILSTDINIARIASINAQNQAHTSPHATSVESGASIYKLFTFEPNILPGNIDKCETFWNFIYTQTNLNPVRRVCSIENMSKKKSTSKNGNKLTNENEIGKYEENKKCIWRETLQELKRMKLDKLAMETSTYYCKLCQFENRTNISRSCPTPAKDLDGIKELNNWKERESSSSESSTM